MSKPPGYSYDAQTAAIERKRKLAEALMQAQMPNGTQMAGGMAVKQGPLQFLAPLIQQQLGAKMGRDATGAESDLQTKRNTQLGEWLQKQPTADPVQAFMPSTGFSDPSRQAGYEEAARASGDVDRNRKIAWALQGNELGPMGQAIGGRALENQLFPAAGKPFTLKPGEQRFDEQGRPVASLPSAASPEKSQLGTVNPGDFTPESLAKFAQSKNYADLVPKPKEAKAHEDVEQFQPLTPEEIAAAGLPAGTSAQKSLKTGKVDVLSRRDNTGVLSQKDATTAKMKLNTVQLARQQLQKIRESFAGIKGSLSAGGFGQGHMPTESGQSFDAAVDQMRSTLTALTRVPGVGAMSDYESKLDQAKFPSRTDYEATTEQKIAGIEDMLALIENGYTGLLSGGAQQSDPAQQQKPAPNSVAPPPSGGVRQFATEAEAEAAGIAPGTRVIIGGVPGTWQ